MKNATRKPEPDVRPEYDFKAGVRGRYAGTEVLSMNQKTAIPDPILSDEDHAQALARIDRLWGSPEGTPEAKTLTLLVAAVEAYESKHHPIGPATSGVPVEAVAPEEEAEIRRRHADPAEKAAPYRKARKDLGLG